MPFVIEQSSLPTLVDSNEWFLNCLLTVSADPSSSLARRFRGRVYVDTVEKAIKSATWSEGRSTSSLSIELANVSDRTAFTRTASIKFTVEEYLSSVWTVIKTYCDGAILATSDYNIENSGNTPNDSFSVTVKSVLQQKLDITPTQIVVLYDPAKVDVADDQLETVPNSDGTTTGAPTTTPYASFNLGDVFDYIADLYGCVGFKSNINYEPWVLSRVDFPAAQPYWNTVAGIIGNHNPHVYIDADNYLVIKDGTLTDYLSARTMTVSNFAGIRSNSTIERFKGCILTRQLGSANWDFWEFRQEVSYQWFGGVSGQYPMTKVTQWFQDFYKLGYDIPAWSQLAVNMQVEYEDLAGSPPFVVSASGELYSYRFDQNGARPTRTHSREWGFANVPTSWATYNSTSLPSPQSDPLAAFLGTPELYSATNVTDHEEALVLTKDENTYYSYRPMFDGRETSYVSQTDSEIKGLITVDTENQQLGTDFAQPWNKAQENGNLAEGQNAYWGITDTRKESQQAEKKRNVALRTRRHSRLNSTQSLVAENYMDRRKGDVGDSDIQTETKPVYITENGDATASLWRSLNGGDAPIEVLIPLAHRLNKSQDYPGGIQADLPTYDETMAIGVVINPSNRAGTSLGIHEVIGYTDEIRNVRSEGGFQTKIQTRQIG